MPTTGAGTGAGTGKGGTAVLRKVGRARDCEWVNRDQAKLGLGSHVCRAVQGRCGANGDCQIPGPFDDMGAMQAWD